MFLFTNSFVLVAIFISFSQDQASVAYTNHMYNFIVLCNMLQVKDKQVQGQCYKNYNSKLIFTQLPCATYESLNDFTCNIQTNKQI